MFCGRLTSNRQENNFLLWELADNIIPLLTKFIIKLFEIQVSRYIIRKRMTNHFRQQMVYY